MTDPQADPPIDEIREIRKRISAQFNNDPDALVAYYMKLQEQYKDRLLDTSKDQDRDQNAA
jgi:hypothetical protein